MEHGIGAAAGQVWKFLKEKGESSTSAIVKGTKLSSTEVHRAIGWLAREDKICMRKDKRAERITLK